MDSTDVTRRAFLATSAGAVATLALASPPPAVARSATGPTPSGVLYGRAGGRGIPGGAAGSPSRGHVILDDGRAIEVPHTGRLGIRAGGSVLLAADDSGGWSILYAEYLG